MGATRRSGFTLVELLVAMGLMAIVMIGLLNILDTSTQVSKVETALADTQENVRFAAYHILRTARMCGGGEMPFVRADGTWVVGEVQDDESGSVQLATGACGSALFGTVQVAPSSDVLTLRGFFELAPFSINRTQVDTGTRTVTINERRAPGDLSSDVINPMDLVSTTANALTGRGIVFMGMRRFQVGEIQSSAVAGAGANQDRTLTLTYDAGTGIWPTLNLAGCGGLGAGEPNFNVYRVGVLQSYVYYVSPDFTLMRRRAATGSPGWVDEPVAINIGSLQVSIGLDTDGDGEPDSFDAAPTAVVVTGSSGVTEMRITVLGRTPFEVREWTEPAATFSIADDDITAADFTAADRSAKWRRMDVATGLRNFTLQG